MHDGPGPGDEEDKAEGQAGSLTTKGFGALEAPGEDRAKRFQPRKVPRVKRRIIVDGAGREYKRVTLATILVVTFLY